MPIRKIILPLLALILLFLIYQFIAKPLVIRNRCQNKAQAQSVSAAPVAARGAINSVNDEATRKELYNSAYTECLRSKGL